MKECSVIVSIVTYNNAKIISDSIKTIIENTNDVDYKVVVYDNASTDDTVHEIESLKDEHIHVVKGKENKGFGFGHNMVTKLFKAKYYVIYNPDVMLKSNIIKELVEYMEKKKEIGMCTPKIKYPNGDIQYLCKHIPTVLDLFIRRFFYNSNNGYIKKRIKSFEMRETGYDKEFLIPYATGCFMFFRGDIFHKIKGFDEGFFMYLEDADITRKVNEVSKCYFFPFDEILHLWAKGAHKNYKLMWINIKSLVYYFNKWGWKIK